MSDGPDASEGDAVPAAESPTSPATAGRGMLMGLADAVPGVSGGTVAFLLGIHPRLVAAIARLRPQHLTALLGGQRSDTWRQLDGNFLVVLGLGIATGLLAGAVVVDRLLESWPIALMAVLLGLVAASIQAPARVPKWDVTDLAAAGIAGLIAFIIGVAPNLQAPSALWFLPIAGAIAATAMILPGISGSYLLVIMGLYVPIIGALAELDVIIIALVGVGAIAGILAFTRGLNHFLTRHRGPTHAAMVGLLAGSLIRLWPWRTEPGFAEGGPMMPDHFSPVLWIIVGALVGLLLQRSNRQLMTQNE